jgi:hypothetical protein
MLRALVSTLVVVAAMGCAAPYSYVPTTGAVVTTHGRAAADYRIPPGGDVQIASFGITKAPRENASKTAPRAIHLRVVLTNRNATPWTFDTREQRISLGGRGLIGAGYAAANAGPTLPVITVPPGEKRVADLLFVLPEDMQTAAEIPQFDALWRVRADSRVVASRTPFERLTPEISSDIPSDNDWYYYDMDSYSLNPPNLSNAAFPNYGH